MQIKGTITATMPVASGTSKSGKEWKRASYILTYDKSNEQYPKSIMFDVMGDRIEKLNLQQNKEYVVDIDFTTREYNGRVFMSASAWKAVEVIAQPVHQPIQQPPVPPQDWEQIYQQPQQAATAQVQPQATDSDPLPF